MQISRLRFAHIFPLISVAAWIILLAAPATLIYFELNSAAHNGQNAFLQSGRFTSTIPRDRFLTFAIQAATSRYPHLLPGMNIPALVVEIVISLPTTWPTTWHPRALLLDSWRSLCWPFFCLPFWWFVGIGLDALFQSKKLHWITLLIGSLLCLAFVFLLFGFYFGISASERMASDMGWVFWGIGVWSLLFSIFPITWLRQNDLR